MRLKLATASLAVLTLAVMHAPMANAQTTDVETTEVEVTSVETTEAVEVTEVTETAVVETSVSTYAAMLETLRGLLERVKELQAQLTEVTGQQAPAGLLGDDLQEGVESDDVKMVQELLATDPEIYPEGLTTGYFGPLTKKAIERFQGKNQLAITGEVDEETRGLIEGFLESDDDNDAEHVSEGLLQRSDVWSQARTQACQSFSLFCDEVSENEQSTDNEEGETVDSETTETENISTEDMETNDDVQTDDVDQGTETSDAEQEENDMN